MCYNILVYWLPKVLKSNTFSEELKHNMMIDVHEFRMVIVSETKPLGKAEELRQVVFEGKVLGKIYSPISLIPKQTNIGDYI